MRFELVGSGASARPAPAGLATVVRSVRRTTGTQPTSLARTVDAVAYARSRGAVLKSQAELYAELPAGQANPPGRSTHEGRNDGVAFAFWPPLFRIPWWAWGQDWPPSKVAEVLAAYRRRGWIATLTYPTNPRENMHINLRKEPKLPRPPLRKGDKGRRVKRLINRLHYLNRPNKRQSYLPIAPERFFDKRVENAVRLFQRDHHLRVDGVVGAHTAAQIAVSHRKQKRSREKD